MSTQRPLNNLFNNIDTKRSFLYLESYKGLNIEEYKKISTEIVDLNSIELIATQIYVFQETLDYYEKSNLVLKPAYGIQHGNRLWIIDGHHRIAYWLLNSLPIQVKIIHLNII